MSRLFAPVLLAGILVAGAAQSEMPFELVAAGERSGIADARQVVVRNEAEWQQFWSEHAPRRPAPAVDFATRMVVGVFLGTRPTSGYGVRIVAVSADGDATRVGYAEQTPGPGAMVMQVLTAPYCLVSVPASGGVVRFEPMAAPARPVRRVPKAEFP